jgi:two-component system cell cycle response regulator
MRILVAEDDNVTRTVLHAHLSAAGHDVLTAVDGADAWTVFQATHGLDVVISDWRMPRMDGPELCRRVRGAGREEYTYFVFATALGERHLVDGMEAGADDYLTKPLDQVELAARLTSAQRVTLLHRTLVEQKRELERLAAALSEQSRTDPLTGLGNRLRLVEDLERLEAGVRRHDHSYCILLCDIDRFKDYNDHYGHQAGDEALRDVSAAIAAGCRSTDYAYRYGGEEFLVILPDVDMSGGLVLAERFRSAVQDLGIVHHRNDPAGVVTVSVGVAERPRRDLRATADEVLGSADRALYEAKGRGRNRVVPCPAREQA